MGVSVHLCVCVCISINFNFPLHTLRYFKTPYDAGEEDDKPVDEFSQINGHTVLCTKFQSRTLEFKQTNLARSNNCDLWIEVTF